MKTCRTLVFFTILLGLTTSLLAQAEVTGWGNLRGIRVNGQLVEFNSGVGVYNADFSQLVLSQREGPIRTNKYIREGNTVTVGENLSYGARRALATAPSTGPATRAFGRFGPPSGFTYTMSYADSASGVCDVTIELTSLEAQTIAGVFYVINLPADVFDKDSVAIDESHVVITGKNNTRVELVLSQPLPVKVRPSRSRAGDEIQVLLPIIAGNTTAGQTASAKFAIKASSDVDTSPVTVTLDPTKTGREWLGVGGNYRIQNFRLDPLHIDYILDHMRVAYGRVAMPWGSWQPREDAEPTTQSTEQGGAMGSVPAAMEIAQKLAQKNIPMIISVWQPPQWANLQTGNAQGGGGGGRFGRARLDPSKYDAICKSIGAYLIYLRDHYNAEPELFSFNESNIGINVLQTPQDHADAIKHLGAYFEKIGLKTKMLLGDTGDVPPFNFIVPAMNDPEAVKYIGAVSFHSWRGATDEQYQKWADAATKLNVPLIDAEGGNDAQASGYPNIFLEPWYSLDEAAEYVRIMRLCQPKAILEWQLTENYSVVHADEKGELQPTQRFWNLKQMNLAPAGSKWVQVSSDNALVLPAAFVKPNETDGTYAIHLVNNGASRQVTLKGLPEPITQLDVYVTDAKRGMEKIATVNPSAGTLTFELEGNAFTTLMNEGQ